MTTTTTPFDPAARIATELSIPVSGVRSVQKLLAEAATVPFIARYRKEQTGGLDEVQIRSIEEKHLYYTEVQDRRVAILAEIDKQGKLTPELKAKIEASWVKSELEDLYLPYKPKRRTRAMIARERGLEPLALRILEQPAVGDLESEAKAFVDVAKEVADIKAAFAGARDIVAETLAEKVEVRAAVRELFAKEGVVKVEAVPEKTKVPTKFETYYGYEEKAAGIPSHRYLAIRRGEAEGILRADVGVEKANAVLAVEKLAGVKPSSPFAGELRTAAAEATSRLLLPSLESDVRVDMKLAADKEAVNVFAENLRKLMLAAPLGRRAVLGIDPGQRTGCKCVALDDTGKLLTHDLVNLVAGDRALAEAKRIVSGLLTKYNPFAIAVGNGTHGRETADFCRDLLKDMGKTDVMIVLVSESGASVYSASDVAREEFPELDLTVRGAISIARRLQDPLAELVKIDPKAIGVGQYQHDVFQPLLKRKLEEVIESCVNLVGVELNTASAPLLAHVAGVGPSLAKKIIKHREEKGAFASRAALKDVPGLGQKTYEQCAGFVRVRGGEHPLDGSSVHPERYSLVDAIAKDLGVEVAKMLGDRELLGRVQWSRYVSPEVGMPTLEDIQKELLKPGRDPRDAFEAPAFRDDVRKMEDLQVGMVLEGVVTNVTAFGAFVDVGVHQDGLIHVSQLADRFVKDPHEVAKVGEKIQVRVLEVDLVRKRIALTAKKEAGSGERQARPDQGKSAGNFSGHGPGGRQNGNSVNDRLAMKPRSGERSTAQPAAKGFTNNPFAQLLKR